MLCLISKAARPPSRTPETSASPHFLELISLTDAVAHCAPLPPIPPIPPIPNNIHSSLLSCASALYPARVCPPQPSSLFHSLLESSSRVNQVATVLSSILLLAHATAKYLCNHTATRVSALPLVPGQSSSLTRTTEKKATP
jgi:hypothetical protein